MDIMLDVQGGKVENVECIVAKPVDHLSFQFHRLASHPMNNEIREYIGLESRVYPHPDVGDIIRFGNYCEKQA
ncbi:MAG: hypothetical protein AB1642_08665 [Pseudomonadota bacterium]